MAVEREFGADAELKSLYHVYLAIVLFGGFLWWMIPTVAFAMYLWIEIGVIIAFSLFLPVLVIAALALYWIPKFHSSILYSLGDDKITVTRGVWWRTKSFVPYNRITNVNIYQGPISRYFRLGKLSIQTAGFSGATSSGGKIAEAVIFGIRNFEEVKDVVMKSVEGFAPAAVEAEAEGKLPRGLNQQILAELRRIRKAVEK